MSVTDRWHKSRPKPGELPCREHDMVPTAEHCKGERWQVRWRDEDGEQRSKNFARKTGKDPERHADAFDAKIQTELDDGSYVSVADANTPFKAYAEDWRKSRTHDVQTAGGIERALRLHVYPAIGHRTLRELAKRPSLTQSWIAGMKLSPGSARIVITAVSGVFLAAIDDGLIARNPVKAQSVTRPRAPEKKAQPWTLDQVTAVAGELDKRYAVLPFLGAGAGPRQGEMFGLAVDDIDFLRRKIHVRRQVRLIGNVRCFAEVKNRKPHEVPLSGSLAPILAEHIRLYPPVAVTLPWQVPDGDPVTFTLLVTRPDGSALHRSRFNESQWHPARKAAGIPATRENGMHALRHTAASAWLSQGISVAAVADWIGDTPAIVHSTYAHLMPDDTESGRKAMDAFFTAGSAASALIVPAEGR